MSKRTPRSPAARAVRAQLRRERRRRGLIWTTVIGVAFLLLAGLAGWGVYAATKQHGVVAPKHASSDATGVVVGGAPVTVDVYLDFLCPACKRLEVEAGPTLRQLIDSERARVIYHPVAYLDRASTNQFSTRSAASSGCASDQDKFVEYTDALFARQPAEGGPGLTDDELIQLAGSIGIVNPVFAQCVRGGTYRPWVDRVNNGASRRGVVGTPTVYVKGQEVPSPSSARIMAAVEAAR